MMVVAPDGEVLVHSNANSLLHLSEEETSLSPFEYVLNISVLLLFIVLGPSSLLTSSIRSFFKRVLVNLNRKLYKLLFLSVHCLLFLFFVLSLLWIAW